MEIWCDGEEPCTFGGTLIFVQTHPCNTQCTIWTRFIINLIKQSHHFWFAEEICRDGARRAAKKNPFYETDDKSWLMTLPLSSNGFFDADVSTTRIHTHTNTVLRYVFFLTGVVSSHGYDHDHECISFSLNVWFMSHTSEQPAIAWDQIFSKRHIFCSCDYDHNHIHPCL